MVAITLGNAGGYAKRALAQAARAFAVPNGLALERAITAFQAVAVAAAGARYVVDYGKPNWPARVREATEGVGCDVVLDAVGGTISRQAIEAAADGHGRIGTYGVASGTWTALDGARIVQPGLTIIGALGAIFSQSDADQHADAERALTMAATGRLCPRIRATYPLERAADALTDLEERRSIGAVLLAT